MIYFASPYTHEKDEVMEHRYNLTALAAAQLIDAGYHIYSPICHSLGISRWLRYPWKSRFEDWAAYNRDMISRCDSMIVLELPGWEKSIGVQAEIRHAKKLGKPVSDMKWNEIKDRWYL